MAEVDEVARLPLAGRLPPLLLLLPATTSLPRSAAPAMITETVAGRAEVRFIIAASLQESIIL